MGFLAPIFTAIGGAVTGAFSWLGGSTILAGVARLGLGIALKYALGAIFQPKQQAQAVQLQTSYGEDMPRSVALGKVGTAGHHIYRNAYGEGNRRIQDVYVLSHFRISSVKRIRVEGEWRVVGDGANPHHGYRVQGVDGEIWQNVHIGTMSQTADVGLIANANPPTRWTADHRGAGVAYAVVMQVLDREKLQQPIAAFFEVEGAPLYDWRKDTSVGGDGSHRWNDQSTWEFSENPVLMMYALERGFYNGTELMVGKGVPASRLPLGPWTMAANICDEFVGGGRRYKAGLIAAAGNGVTHDANMQPLMEACAATWVEDASGEYPLVGAEQAVVATFTDDDLMIDEPFRFSKYRTRSELVNTVAGTWRDPESFYETVPFATRIDIAAVAEDRERLAASIPYGAVNDVKVADRLADIAIRASRYQANAAICLHPKFLDRVPPGRWVRWNSAKHGDRKFQIGQKRLGPLGQQGARNIYLELQEAGAGIFDPTEYTTTPTLPTAPGEAVYASSAANFIASGVQMIVAGSPERIPGLRFTWNAFDDITVVAVEVEYRPLGATDSIIKRADVPVLVLATGDGILADADYQYRHRLITAPVRTTFWTDWSVVSTPAAALPSVSVGLEQVKTDIYQLFRTLSLGLDDAYARLEQIALAASDAAGVVTEQHAVAVRFRNATAAAMLGLTASVEDIDGQLTAMAEALLGVEASVGNVSAGGLIQFKAQVPPPAGVLAQINVMARATVDGDFKESGMVIQVYDDAGTIKSRVAIFTDKFVVTDGTSSGSPLVFEGSELKLQVARMATAIVEVLHTPSEKTQLGDFGGGAEGLRLFA
ncbi:phage tail protein [Aminobacter sp. NyZ550]|uniref:phage tail protein n=1 Tax=Aminobacter sp. NyZ550 TaxID=2979870 RepID=UPI0021D58F32|nr:phage tail protein [Aminobacter sp. NyZ550]WAX93203.1 phage tail protein [Aminobacter sp. NyZ550]